MAKFEIHYSFTCGKCRVPHFSRSLREVGLFAETIPNLNQHSAEFSPPTKSSR
jgi:hypothetical protein